MRSASSTSTSVGKGGSSSSAIGVGGPLSDLIPRMNSLASFSMYDCWESQRDLLGRSLNMWIPRNHFNFPIIFSLKCFRISVTAY